MSQESSQLSNNFAELSNNNVGEIIIKHNGTIVSEAVVIQSTAGVELSNNLGMLSEANQ